MQVLFITDEMMEVFVTGCPDYRRPVCESTITFPEEVRVHPVTEAGMSVVPIRTYRKIAIERRRLYLDYSCWLEETRR